MQLTDKERNHDDLNELLRFACKSLLAQLFIHVEYLGEANAKDKMDFSLNILSSTLASLFIEVLEYSPRGFASMREIVDEFAKNTLLMVARMEQKYLNEQKTPTETLN